MNRNKNSYLTKDGLKELKKELEFLVEEKKPKLIKRVTIARNHGDLSENSEYTAAREELSFAEVRVRELEELISKAKIIENSKSDKVALGSKVTVKINGEVQTYEVVGELEADPMKKKISDTSPLGKALLGKKKGSKIEVEVPAGKVKYYIDKIN
ncbi:MAG: transcription elongation factor GreA [Patescibacteria group bacterium]|nr:transcription elongation factor GreA [Patescibacteria group bacterium]